MVAKGFDASEVNHAHTVGIEQRLVYAEIVGISVHISHWLLEGNHLGTKREQEILGEVGGRLDGASVETLYYFRLRK